MRPPLTNATYVHNLQHVPYSNPGINKQLDTGVTNCVVRTLEPVPQERRPDIVDDKSHVMKHTVCESGVCLHCVSLGGLSLSDRVFVGEEACGITVSCL